MSADTGLGYDLGNEISSDQPVDGEQANWELARLTHENTWMPGRRGESHRREMSVWCADVEKASGRSFGPRTGARYKRLWTMYGTSPAMVRPSFTEEISKLSYTDKTARERWAQYDAGKGGGDTSPEVKCQVFQQLAQDHDVIEDAVNLSSPTAHAVTDLNHKCAVLLGQHRDQLLGEDPIASARDHQGAGSRAERRLRTVRCGQGPTPVSDQVAITPEVRGRALLPG